MGRAVPVANRKWTRFTHLLWVGTVLFAASLPGRAMTAPLPFPDRVISYQVVEQDLPALLDGLAHQIGLHASVSSKVEGRVHGRLAPDTAGAMLDTLAALYGFEWYVDGQTIYVSAASEDVSKVIALRGRAAAALPDTLTRLGIADPRWPVRLSQRSDVAQIAGPPHYVSLIEQTIAALPEPRATAAIEVQVFRGSTAP